MGTLEPDAPTLSDTERLVVDVANASERSPLSDEQDAALKRLLKRARSEKCKACGGRVRSLLVAITETFESAVRHHETRGKGGQQVSFHGDFANVQPSAVGRMRWWAREFRAALKEQADD